MKNITNTLRKINPAFLFFSFSFFSIYSIISLFYDSTQGSDYEKYSNYLNYFLYESESTYLEQGLIYYYIISFFISLFSYQLNPENIDNIFSLGIQVGNFYIFIIGLVGLFFLLKMYHISLKNILLTLGIVCFFPQTISLLVTFKPEILAFTLLIWSIYFIELYISKNNNLILYLSAFPLSLLLTTKGSVMGMLGLFFLIKYRTSLGEFNIKILTKALLLFLVCFVLILNENYQANSLFILDPPHDQTIYNEKAPVSIIYNINFKELASKPYQHEHRDSLIGIYLLDTFDDYFQQYWNYDNSLFDQNRKDIFSNNSSEKTVTIDFKNREINYSGPGNFYLLFLRQYAAIFLGLIFYFLIFKHFKRSSNIKVFILSPLIGILISVINSVLGFPQKNFDTSRADSFKTFYFSFFLVLSFAFIVSKLLNSDSNKKYPSIFIYLVMILFIIGFPKANNDEFDYKISENNKYSMTCQVNSIFLKSTLFETSNVKCPKVEEIICEKEFFNRKSSIMNLVHNDSPKVTVNNYQDCLSYTSIGYRFDNNIFELKNIPFINLIIYILFKLSMVLLILKYEK